MLLLGKDYFEQDPPALPPEETIQPGEVLRQTLWIAAFDQKTDDPFVLCGFSRQKSGGK